MNELSAQTPPQTTVPAPPATTPIHLVWYKRDLRVDDHAPLRAAMGLTDAGCTVASAAASVRSVAGTGPASGPIRAPVVALYAFEPDVLASPEVDRGHLAFITASLRELREELRARNVPLLVLHASLPEALDRLHATAPIAAIHSHEETGLEVTWARDRAVAAWCARAGVRWSEHRAFGVLRGLRNRDGWGSRWSQFMDAPPLPAPEPQPRPPRELLARIAAAFGDGALVSTLDDGLPSRLLPGPDWLDRPGAQPGGRAAGLRLLDTFMAERSVEYRRALAAPQTAWTGGSRFSPHLAWGTLSLREVHHATVTRRRELAALRDSGTPGLDPRWIPSLDSFAKRLRWHCHFIQKLESEPDIEFRNMNRAFDGMRHEDESSWSSEQRDRFAAWAAGRTGYPMVDAGMRCLAHTGWINFRMRAMLVSFATQHLWLHWRPVARELARRFVDFEPGIHISQCQMQAGVTGINALRIYSPSKQVLDHDPRGRFIREWVPELASVPDEWLPHPEQMPMSLQERIGCRIVRDAGAGLAGRGESGDGAGGGRVYPAPIVDHREAVRHARAEHGKVRRSAEARDENLRVYRRHGSRKGGRRRTLSARRPDSGQLDLGL